MAQKSSIELAKERIIQLYGTENCSILVNMTSSEEAFSVLKRNIRREFSKYEDDLAEEQYQQFIEEIFGTFIEYKISLESVCEDSYGQIFGDYAVKITQIKKKYGV